MRIPLAGPGLAFVLGGLCVAALGVIFLPWGLAASALGLFFAGFSAYFFRDPERVTPSDPSAIYSPGDGTVLVVRKEGPGDLITVRIFLSVMNVHVQRAPIAGTVEKIHYQPGGFAMAMKPEARENERNVVTFTNGEFHVVVEQIAGFVARRIECWVEVGRALAAGERYGMIRYGSQAAVHLPDSCEILVKAGDKVAGGLTPIARRPKP